MNIISPHDNIYEFDSQEKNIRLWTNEQMDGQTIRVTMSLLKLLIAAKNS